VRPCPFMRVPDCQYPLATYVIVVVGQTSWNIKHIRTRSCLRICKWNEGRQWIVIRTPLRKKRRRRIGRATRATMI